MCVKILQQKQQQQYNIFSKLHWMSKHKWLCAWISVLFCFFLNNKEFSASQIVFVHSMYTRIMYIPQSTANIITFWHKKKNRRVLALVSQSIRDNGKYWSLPIEYYGCVVKSSAAFKRSICDTAVFFVTNQKQAWTDNVYISGWINFQRFKNGIHSSITSKILFRQDKIAFFRCMPKSNDLEVTHVSTKSFVFF